MSNNRVVEFRKERDRQFKSSVKEVLEIENKVFEGIQVANIPDVEKLSIKKLRLLRSELFREIQHCRMLQELYIKNKAPSYMLKGAVTKEILLRKYRRAVQEEIRKRIK